MLRRSLLLLAALAATATISPAAHASVPDAIKAPKGHVPYFQSHAVGVQIYSCGASGWTFVAPRADLYGPLGLLRIGTHFAGPTWRTFSGSEFVGRSIANATVDPTAIPWLLLERVSTKPGLFGKASFVQRINTRGGLAPDGGKCSTPGKTVEVPYTADYRFLTAF